MARAPIDVLLSVTRALSETKSLRESMRATTDAALEILPADHASVRLFDAERRELLSTARSGAGSDAKPRAFRAGWGVLGLVADQGRAAMVEDTRTDPRFESAATGFTVRSLVAVPLIAAGGVIGVMSASNAAPNSFTEHDCALAQLLANCCVPAIETARLAHLSIIDDLTGAYNHRYLQPRLEEEVALATRYGTPFSVLMMDLDHFKRVNDTYGHSVGDRVLQRFSELVLETVRRPDVFVRRGGEEFLLLMPSTPAEEARQVAERIREVIGATPIELPDTQSVPITVSLGVATWSPGESGSEVEVRADKALYRAKAEGRDGVREAAVT